MEVLVEVQQQIRKLHTSLDQEKYPANSITTLETLLEQLVDEIGDNGDNEAVQNAKLQAYCQELISTLSELKGATNKLVSLLNNAEAEKQEMRQDISRLEKKMLSLEKEVRLLKQIKQNLALGQLAFLVDRALLDKVLKDSGCRSAKKLHIRYIQDMEWALNDKEHYRVFHEDEKIRVKECWRELKKTLSWEDEHYRHLGYLKSIRLSDAHPPLTLDEMKGTIEKEQDEELKCFCWKFLAILEKVKPNHCHEEII